MNGQALKLSFTGSQFGSEVGSKKFQPNVVRAAADSRHRVQPMASARAITMMENRIRMTCQGMSPCWEASRTRFRKIFKGFGFITFPYAIEPRKFAPCVVPTHRETSLFLWDDMLWRAPPLARPSRGRGNCSEGITSIPAGHCRILRRTWQRPVHGQHPAGRSSPGRRRAWWRRDRSAPTAGTRAVSGP